MTKEQLQQNLLLQKSNNNNNQKKASFLQLFKHSDRNDKYLMLLGTLAAIGAGVASPLFMIFFSTISEIFVPGNENKAESQGRQLFIQLFLIGVLTWACHALAMWAWNKSGSRQTARLKKLYFQALLKQEISWYDQTDTSKITTQISQNTLAIQTAIGQKIAFTITALTTSLFGFIFSIVKCWQMSLYLALFLPFMLISGFLFMKSLGMKAQTGKMSYQAAANVAQTAFGSIKTIKILVSQKFQFKKFSNALQNSQSKLIKHMIYSSMASGFMNLIMMGLYSFGFFIGKQMMIDNPGRYKSSQIISTFFCFMVSGQSVGLISPIFKNIADAKIAYQKIYKIMNRQQTIIQNQTGMQIDRISTVQIKNLQFHYKNLKISDKIQQNQQKKNILDNISLKIKKGTVTAIVGASGSGKSTICQLLLNFYAVNSGKIQLNGFDINTLNIYKLRKKIGYVGQQPILFSMTIKQNIKLTNPQISDKQIQQILKKSFAWNFIEKLENGINTYVGSKGTQLSGGQKQRIAIARALAKYPQLIIFDQATSALDQQSERYIQKTISKLVEQNAIVLVIAHRLSSIKDADNIIVLDHGKIVQSGRHQQLLKQKNFYYKLVHTQLQKQNENQHEKLNEQKDQNNIKYQESLMKNRKQLQKNQNKSQNYQIINKSRSRIQIYQSLLRYAFGYRKYLFFGSIFALVNGLVYPFFNITFSTLMGLMSNPEENNTQINYYCLVFLIISIIGATSNFSHTFLYGYFGEKLVLTLRIKVFKKILKFACSYFDKKQNTPGAISMKLSQDSYQLHNALTGFMSVIFLNLSTITVSLAFAFTFSWKLTLILLVFSPLMAAKGAIQSSVMKRMSKKSDEIQKSLGSFISDTISNIKTVKSFGGYNQFMHIFNQNVNKMENLISSKFLKMGILQGFSKSSAVLSYAIIFWVAAALFAHNQFQKPTDALIAIFCIIFSASTVGQNSQLMPDLIKAQIAANNILNILQTQDQFQIAKNSEIKSLKKYKISGKVDLISVSFKYPSRSQKILNNLTLHIKQGEKVAIVGSSGSGKSTLISILARLYPIESGKVLIDGYQLQKFNLKKLRKQLGILGQQPTIFKGTIQQNILYQFVNNQKYQKRFFKHCKICCVDQMVQQFENKYQQQVGERGCLVSGGQKQRIAMARCLIRKPNILIMDQPTSALDIQNEEKIFKNLSKVQKNKTFIFTAHRLSTVKNADKIAVMKQGQIIQQGSYEQLLERKQEFYKIVYGNTQDSLKF